MMADDAGAVVCFSACSGQRGAALYEHQSFSCLAPPATHNAFDFHYKDASYYHRRQDHCPVNTPLLPFPFFSELLEFR